MLTRLTKTMRGRAAITLTLAYVLCVVGPSAALALIDGPSAIHCATKPSHSGAAPVHDLDGGAAHLYGGHGSDQTKSDGKSQTATCCGTFCVSAMPAATAPDVIPLVGVRSTEIAIDHGIAGHGPPRIDRPPIVLLPR